MPTASLHTNKPEADRKIKKQGSQDKSENKKERTAKSGQTRQMSKQKTNDETEYINERRSDANHVSGTDKSTAERENKTENYKNNHEKPQRFCERDNEETYAQNQRPKHSRQVSTENASNSHNKKQNSERKSEPDGAGSNKKIIRRDSKKELDSKINTTTNHLSNNSHEKEKYSDIDTVSSSNANLSFHEKEAFNGQGSKQNSQRRPKHSRAQSSEQDLAFGSEKNSSHGYSKRETCSADDSQRGSRHSPRRGLQRSTDCEKQAWALQSKTQNLDDDEKHKHARKNFATDSFDQLPHASHQDPYSEYHRLSRQRTCPSDTDDSESEQTNTQGSTRPRKLNQHQHGHSTSPQQGQKQTTRKGNSHDWSKYQQVLFDGDQDYVDCDSQCQTENTYEYQEFCFPEDKQRPTRGGLSLDQYPEYCLSAEVDYLQNLASTKSSQTLAPPKRHAPSLPRHRRVDSQAEIPCAILLPQQGVGCDIKLKEISEDRESHLFQDHISLKARDFSSLSFDSSNIKREVSKGQLTIGSSDLSTSRSNRSVNGSSTDRSTSGRIENLTSTSSDKSSHTKTGKSLSSTHIITSASTEQSISTDNSETISSDGLLEKPHRLIRLEKFIKLNSIGDKKREKSANSFFDFATKKLPRWAAFYRRFDGSIIAAVASFDRKDKKKSTKTTDSSLHPEKTENNATKDDAPACRWFVSNEEEIQGASQTPAGSFESSECSGEVNQHHRSSTFSFFKPKSTEDVKSSMKKDKALKSGKVTKKGSKDSDKVEVDGAKRKRSVQMDLDPGDMAAGPSEKPPKITKQKSKEKPVSRKNSMRLGRQLRDRYVQWWGAVVSAREQVRAASAEALTTPEGLRAHPHFLDASMRIFLVVSPPIRLQVRSRSLNNLTSSLARSRRLLQGGSERLVLGSSLEPSYYVRASMPELSAKDHKDGLPYFPGPTKGLSAFSRRSRPQLRHAYSQGFQRDFFLLNLGHGLDLAQSPGPNPSLFKAVMKNRIFIPAVSDTSLRNTTDNVLRCLVRSIPGAFVGVSEGGSCSTPALPEYTLHADDIPVALPLDATSPGLLAGRTITLHEKPGRIRNFFRKSSMGIAVPLGARCRTRRALSMCAPPTGVRVSGPLAVAWPAGRRPLQRPAISAQPKWTSSFANKTNSLLLERLEAHLNELSEVGVPLVPGYRPQVLSALAFEALHHMQSTQLEFIFTNHELSPSESKRQRVILELITTEAAYISHIRTVIEVFYSVAYSLQQDGLILDVDLKRLFGNLPEILNVNIAFWGNTIYPLLAEALARKANGLAAGFNTQLLYDGFFIFREHFRPYERYVQEQNKIQKYSKELIETNPVYAAFLTWCEAHDECTRLKLSDLLVKPMQRLTKYSLLLGAILKLTDYEPEKKTLKIMYKNTRKYVHDVNTAIRYREETEIMANIVENIESYDILEIKDEEVMQLFQQHSDLRLRAPMIGCDPQFKRTLVLEGDLKFKDHRDVRLEVRVILFTDTMLISLLKKKKQHHHPLTYKIIRQKYLVDRLRVYPQHALKDGSKELSALLCIVLDETETATSYFSLHETSSTSSRQVLFPLKKWQFAIREAQATLELSRKLYRENDQSYYDSDSESSDSDGEKKEGRKLDPWQQAAKMRVAMMKHGANLSMDTDNTDVDATYSGYCRDRTPMRGKGDRSRTSSRASRLSSLQHSYSGSYDITEYSVGNPKIAAGSAETSTERRTTSMSSDEGIFPIGVSDGCRSRSPSGRGPRPSTPCGIAGTSNTLSVQSPHLLGQSMPNLTEEQSSPAISICPSQVSIHVPQVNCPLSPSRSRQMYLRAGHPGGTLSPDTRGTSYPPPSPTRASLRRGFAFSSTIKNPPLQKTRHISRDTGYPIVPVKIEKSPAKPGSSRSVTEAFNTLSRGTNFLTIPDNSQSEPEPGGEESRRNDR